MIHLSCLLLPLQFCYLFIYSFYNFSLPFHFSSYSSQLRSSSVNALLTFNDSLILLAPSAPILLSVHLFLLFLFSSFSFLFLFITSQIQISQCSINLQCFTYLACSFCSNSVICSFVHFHFHFILFFICILIHHYPDTVQSM